MSYALNRRLCERMDETGMDGYAVVAELCWDLRDARETFRKSIQYVIDGYAEVFQAVGKAITDVYSSLQIGRKAGRSAYAEQAGLYFDRMHTEFTGNRQPEMYWEDETHRMAPQPAVDPREALLEARRHRNTGPSNDLVQNHHRPRRHQ